MADNLNLDITVSYGSDPGLKELFFDYSEPATTTGTKRLTIPLSLGANATDQTVNLGTFFTECKVIAVIDRGGKGVKVGSQAGAGKFTVAPTGALVLRNGSGSAPTLYLDNASSTDPNDISVVALGS